MYLLFSNDDIFFLERSNCYLINNVETWILPQSVENQHLQRPIMNKDVVLIGLDTSFEQRKYFVWEFSKHAKNV